MGATGGLAVKATAAVTISASMDAQAIATIRAQANLSTANVSVAATAKARTGADAGINVADAYTTATGRTHIKGQLIPALADATTTATATLKTHGSLNTNLQFTLDASGSVSEGRVEGALARSIGNFTLIGEADLIIKANANLTLANAFMTADSLLEYQGRANLILNDATMTATGISTRKAVGNPTASAYTTATGAVKIKATAGMTVSAWVESYVSPHSDVSDVVEMSGEYLQVFEGNGSYEDIVALIGNDDTFSGTGRMG